MMQMMMMNNMMQQQNEQAHARAMEREHAHEGGGGGGAPVVVNVQGGAPQMLIKPPPNCCMKCCCPPCAVWMHEVSCLGPPSSQLRFFGGARTSAAPSRGAAARAPRPPLLRAAPSLRCASQTPRGPSADGAAACLFLQGMGGNFIMALVAWLCGVGWCFTMCCWVPDPYGKQPRPAVTDMER